MSLVWNVIKTLYCSGKQELQPSSSANASREEANSIPGPSNDQASIAEVPGVTIGQSVGGPGVGDRGETPGGGLSEDNDTETDETEQQDRALTTIASGLANAQVRNYIAM